MVKLGTLTSDNYLITRFKPSTNQSIYLVSQSISICNISIDIDFLPDKKIEFSF